MANPLPNVGKGQKYGDLKRRLLFLLGALVVFRIGAHIPVPGIDPVRLAELFSGQRFKRVQFRLRLRDNLIPNAPEMRLEATADRAQTVGKIPPQAHRQRLDEL